MKHAHHLHTINVNADGTRAPDTPWMGLRARLRSSYSCNAALQTPAARIMCTTMQKYGLILSDIGGGWYITGEASASWSDVIPASQMAAFQADMAKMRGSDMEVVMPPGGLLCGMSCYVMLCYGHDDSFDLL